VSVRVEGGEWRVREECAPGGKRQLRANTALQRSACPDPDSYREKGKELNRTEYVKYYSLKTVDSCK
jgi:hypothetical protein